MLGISPKRQLFLTPCSTHLPNNDQPSMHAETDSQLDTFVLLQTGIAGLPWQRGYPNPVRTARWASSSWAWG